MSVRTSTPRPLSTRFSMARANGSASSGSSCAATPSWAICGGLLLSTWQAHWISDSPYVVWVSRNIPIICPFYQPVAAAPRGGIALPGRHPGQDKDGGDHEDYRHAPPPARVAGFQRLLGVDHAADPAHGRDTDGAPHGALDFGIVA